MKYSLEHNREQTMTDEFNILSEDEKQKVRKYSNRGARL